MANFSDKSCDPDKRIHLLSALASDVMVDKNIPPKRYFRSGRELERMAAVYLDEQNLENAFILYMKFIVLFVEKLPKHPQYKQADQAEIKRILTKIKQIFPITERLKLTIKKSYQEEFDVWKAKEAERIAEKERIEKEQEARLQRQKEDKLLEFKNVNEEDNPPHPTHVPVPTIVAPTATSLEADYPSVPETSTLHETITEDSLLPPAYSSVVNTSEIPDVQYKTTESYDEIIPSEKPIVDRTSKPSPFIDRQISTSIGGVRKMYIPQELIDRFITIASYNTRNNLETCGVLTGKLANNIFQISHLVIPKQTATPDSCTTSNEEEMFDVLDKYDLVTLGWIHTHPTQTSFLSSVDLHTQYAYQIMMPEAVAIVCAPKYSQVGVYRLTTNHGLGFIGSCTQAGFHPHPKEPPLFEDSEHTHIDNTMRVKVVDLR